MTPQLLVPFGNYLTSLTGSWNAIFEVIVAFNVLTALLALVALKPVRRRTTSRLGIGLAENVRLAAVVK